MDPITVGTTVVGLALGGAQLSIQVFESVVKGFEYFESASHADQECIGLKIRLRYEYLRLEKWGSKSGLKDEETRAQYDKTMGDRRLLVLAILSEIKAKLRKMRTTELRYDSIMSKDDIEESKKLDEELFHTTAVIDDISDSQPNPATGDQADSVLDYADPVPAEAQDLNDAEWQMYNEAMAVGEEPLRPRKYKKGLNHIMAWKQGAGRIAKQPKRLVWALKDRTGFTRNIDQVHILIDSLLETLSPDHMAQLIRQSQEILLGMTAMSKNVSELLALHQMTTQDSTQSIVNGSWASSWGGSTLVNRSTQESESGNEDLFASEKVFKMFISQVTDFSIRVKETPFGPLADTELTKTVIASIELDQVTDSTLRQSAKVEGQPAWIEWKPYTMEPHYLGEGRTETRPHAIIWNRAQRLGSLLQTSEKPKEFCVPPFLGLYDDRKRNRFGFVYRPPAESFDQSIGTTLSARLQGKPAALGERIAIAQQLTQWLLYLHTVDWLHKGIRPEAVVFFPRKNASTFGPAYISGFEYSRVIDMDTVTTGPGETDLKGAFYIHPDYSQGYRFRKTYDMYSIGIVLIELACWKPISQILSESSKTDQDTQVNGSYKCQNTRDKILDPEQGVLAIVEQSMGRKYAAAVRACIEGMSAFGLAEDKDQADALISGLLQHAFIRVVVNPLQSIVV